MNGFEVENKRISQERMIIFLQYVLLWMIILQKIREILENEEVVVTNSNLSGYKIDENNKRIIVDINQNDAIENAYAAYLILSALGYSYQLENNGIIVHCFTDEKFVKQYVNSITPADSHCYEIFSFISTSTGIASDLLDGVDCLGYISTITGFISTANDGIDLFNEPSFGRFLDLSIDIYGFLNPLEAFVLSETKQYLTDTGEKVVEAEKTYQKQKAINKFSQQYTTDMNYLILNELHNQFKNGRVK